MPETRPYRIFLSGNCQMQFVFDALKQVYAGEPGIALTYRAAYRAVRAGDEVAARECDLHIGQVANLATDPWASLVPARARRIRVPALALPGLFHALAPRVHPDHGLRGRPPYYLARGNSVLNDLVARRRRGEAVSGLVAAYLAYSGGEIETAPRLMEMNCVAMRRIGQQADFDPWRIIEPRLAEQRFFWSVKHPTLGTAMLLVRGVLDIVGLPGDAAALEGLARGPEYHEPYHAPIHPRLAEKLGLAWAGDETRYRFFHSYVTAAEHASRYIGGEFGREFALNKAIQDARARRDDEATATALRANRAIFPGDGQADLWYGRVLQRLGKSGMAAFYYRRALDGAGRAAHRVPHRADVPPERIAAWLKRCRKHAAPMNFAARLARLEAEEKRLLAQIRALNAKRRLAALRDAARAPR